jgi:hypothetical protein
MAASGIQRLPPPPINDPMLIIQHNEDGESSELRLTQQWQDYFNLQWTLVQQLIDYSNLP